MPDSAARTRPLPPVRGWRRLALVLSVVTMVVGGGLWAAGLAVGSDTPTARTTSTPTATPGVTPGGLPIPGFVPVDGPVDGPGDGPGDLPDDGDGSASGGSDSALREWSPMIFRLGFSFFVGFAIAYALRTFLKVSIVTIGILLLGLFGLQYAGVITVDWAAMEQHYDTVVAWLRTETETFRTFVTGYLPSSAMGVLGMVVGFRRGA